MRLKVVYFEMPYEFFVLFSNLFYSSMEPRGGFRQILSKDLQISSTWRLQSNSAAKASGVSANYSTRRFHCFCSTLCKLSGLIQVVKVEGATKF